VEKRAKKGLFSRVFVDCRDDGQKVHNLKRTGEELRAKLCQKTKREAESLWLEQRRHLNSYLFDSFMIIAMVLQLQTRKNFGVTVFFAKSSLYSAFKYINN